jgi:hypothetical protein
MFAPAAAGDVGDEARRVSLAAMTNLMCRGRKRGLAGVIATQRLAKLAKNVAAEASNFLMGRTFLDIDMARAADLLGMERRQAETFRNLERGHFVALGPAIGRRAEVVRIGPVETAGRGGGPKLSPPPGPAPEDARDLIFKAVPGEVAPRAALSAQPTTADILGELARSRAAAIARAGEPGPEAEPAPDAAEREAAWEAVLADVLAEPEAGFQPVSVLYQDFLVRCRIARVPGEAVELPEFRRRLALARAGLEPGGVDEEAWSRATLVAGTLPEDVRGVFLLVARAALTRAPCPSDDEIARAYGTRSAGRARRVLGWMEERGYLVVAADMRGNRIVQLPDLGWQTAPGGEGRVAAE